MVTSFADGSWSERDADVAASLARAARFAVDLAPGATPRCEPARYGVATTRDRSSMGSRDASSPVGPALPCCGGGSAADTRTCVPVHDSSSTCGRRSRSPHVTQASRPSRSSSTFAGDTSSIREARIFVREQVATTSIGSGRSGDMELAVSELVTNAIEHAHDEAITVSVDASASSVSVSVSSSYAGSDLDDPSTWAGPHPKVRSGRGLAIVRAVSDDVMVSSDRDVLTVTCTFNAA